MEIGAEVVDGGAIEVGDGDEVPDALQPANNVVVSRVAVSRVATIGAPVAARSRRLSEDVANEVLIVHGCSHRTGRLRRRGSGLTRG
jgi:hypothetical protein